MFGLTKLHHVGDVETTLDKIHFLIQNVMTKSNRLTAIISFSALFALVAFRYFKNKFKGIWWIYRLPEVLIVVVASTSQIYLDGAQITTLTSSSQFFLPNSNGRNMVSIFLAQLTYGPENPSSNSLSRHLIANCFDEPLQLPCPYGSSAFIDIRTYQPQPR